MIRVLPGNDLVMGIEEACERSAIRSGSVSCCIGSLRKASFMFLVPFDSRMGAAYCDPVTVDGPVEILSVQGTVGEEEGGNLYVHLHGSFVDKEGHVHGGHLVRGQNPVLFTAEIMLCTWDGVRMLRLYDPEVDMKVLTPLEHEEAPGPKSHLSKKNTE
jgi:predicted DNA-binding protein with PD1-like motif